MRAGAHVYVAVSQCIFDAMFVKRKEADYTHLAPISKIESLDFCAISESESNVVPFKFVYEHTLC